MTHQRNFYFGRYEIRIPFNLKNICPSHKRGGEGQDEMPYKILVACKLRKTVEAFPRTIYESVENQRLCEFFVFQLAS